MPAHKKKTTTSTSPEATSTVSSAAPVKPENFHQYLRAEIRHATRLVMEEIMREELSGLSSSQMGRMYPGAQRLSQRLLHARFDDHLWPH